MLTIQGFTVNPFQENTYIVFNEDKQAIIVDPGAYFDEEKNALKNFLFQHQLELVQLVNTHCHLDHVFANEWVHETYALELYMHEQDLPTLEIATASGTKYGLPFQSYIGTKHFLQEGDSVFLGIDRFDIMFVPGHAPGHIALYNSEQNILLSGDVLFREGIGRTDLPGSNHQDLVASIKDKLYLLPDNTTVFSGHGPTTTIGHEKMHNPFIRG